MLNFSTLSVQYCVHQLQSSHFRLFGGEPSRELEFVTRSVEQVFQYLDCTNALYHNTEHTLLVTLAGQEILQGKHRTEGNVSPHDWMHVTLALLCHDVGFVFGSCRRDRLDVRLGHTGIGDEMVALPPGSTDAFLAPYHIERGKRFVAEQFEHCSLVDIPTLQTYIELTRFPVPDAAMYRDTRSYAGLTRAADLIGQLSDPRYLQKTTALFYEFEETGANQAMGYHHPDDLCGAYPKFFHNVVYGYIADAIAYLEATSSGQALIHDLYRNVHLATHGRSLPPEVHLQTLSSSHTESLSEDKSVVCEIPHPLSYGII